MARQYNLMSADGHLEVPPERWVHRIRGIEGVERAEPYIVMFGQTTMPDGRSENVVVVGSEPGSLLGNARSMVLMSTGQRLFTGSSQTTNP